MKTCQGPSIAFNASMFLLFNLKASKTSAHVHSPDRSRQQVVKVLRNTYVDVGVEVSE